MSGVRFSSSSLATWEVYRVTDSSVADCRVEGYQVDIWHCTNLSCSGNALVDTGLKFHYGGPNPVANNTFSTNSSQPLSVYGGGGSLISDNNITLLDPSDGTCAVLLYNPSVTMRGNHMWGAGIAFYLHGYPTSDTLDIDLSNTVGGRPLISLYDARDLIVEGDYGQVIVGASHNVTIRGLIMSTGQVGCLVYKCDAVAVTDCYFENLTDTK